MAPHIELRRESALTPTFPVQKMGYKWASEHPEPCPLHTAVDPQSGWASALISANLTQRLSPTEMCEHPGLPSLQGRREDVTRLGRHTEGTPTHHTQRPGHN